jgi:hypothetical protein
VIVALVKELFANRNVQQEVTVEVDDIKITATGKSIDVDEIAEQVVRLSEARKAPKGKSSK